MQGSSRAWNCIAGTYRANNGTIVCDSVFHGLTMHHGALQGIMVGASQGMAGCSWHCNASYSVTGHQVHSRACKGVVGLSNMLCYSHLLPRLSFHRFLQELLYIFDRLVKYIAYSIVCRVVIGGWSILRSLH